MRGTRLRSTMKSVVAILCAACFLTVSLGSVSRAVAADTLGNVAEKDDRARRRSETGHGRQRGGQGRRCGGEEGRDGILLRNDRLDRRRSRRGHRYRDRRRRRRVHFEPLTDRWAISRPPFSPIHARNPIRFLCHVASAAFLVLSLCPPARAASPEDHPAVPAILARAESLFQSMKVATTRRSSPRSARNHGRRSSRRRRPPWPPPRSSASPARAAGSRHRGGPKRFRRGRADRARLLGRLPSPLRPGRRPGAQPLGDRLRGEGPRGDPPHPPWRGPPGDAENVP